MKVQEKNVSDRKKDHIELATQSQVSNWLNDKRFFYEPLLGSHAESIERKIPFFNKTLQFPLWVSSMTGGTTEAQKINENLASVCMEFGLGMGLGSCRILLEYPEKFQSEFKIRSFIGDQPLFANLGIAQIEKDLEQNSTSRIEDMLGLLEADGLTIHVNPLQEWIQPEGDKIKRPPIETIIEFLDRVNVDVIVKEVGQGMGPKSLEALMKLPVMVEFGAFGGTNFSQVEMARKQSGKDNSYQELVNIGHNMDEMISYTNQIIDSGGKIEAKGIIASGGVKSFLDGYFAVNSLKINSVYGQASELLKMARISYMDLKEYVQNQINGYALAEQYLKIREEK